VADTAQRLLRLLSLFQARPAWGGPELAGRLDVDVRTVRRDVGRLRELGYRIDAGPGASGGYRLADGHALPPLVFDDDEAVALAVCLRAAAGGSVAGVADSARAALAKLEPLLPTRLRPRVAALSATTLPLRDEGGDVDPGALVALAEAARETLVATFAYRDGQGRLSERRVEPYRLVHTGRRWYLVARDLGHGDWRTFRVDRIGEVVVPGHQFDRTDPPDAAALVAHAITTAPYAHRAVVELDAPFDDVAAMVPATVAVVEAIDAATTRLTTGADDLDRVAVYLAAQGWPFRVVEPPELRQRLLSLADRLVAAARTEEVVPCPPG
jgi:predicted DNA-binding transcriptional regulator YafY